MRRLVVLVVAASIFAGCSESKGEPQPEATAIESTKNELPRGWPAGFPLPPDYKIVFSKSEPEALGAFIQTAVAREEVKALMLRELPAKGWTLIRCAEGPGTGGVVTTLQATNSGVLADITVGTFPEVSQRVKQPYQVKVQMIRTKAAVTGPGCS